MCQTMWQCPDCGERMLARHQWGHQCEEAVQASKRRRLLPLSDRPEVTRMLEQAGLTLRINRNGQEDAP